jgi:hypothetical protein
MLRSVSGVRAPRSLTVGAHVLRATRSAMRSSTITGVFMELTRGSAATRRVFQTRYQCRTADTGAPDFRRLAISRGIVDSACVRVEGSASSARANPLRRPTRAGNHGLDSLMTSVREEARDADRSAMGICPTPQATLRI